MLSSKSSLRTIPIVLILLVHVGLRLNQSASFPLFIDEFRHISRAQLVYDLSHNPVEQSHGKVLLYFWLGAFDPQKPGGLAVSRWAIALISLFSAAAAASVARDLFGRRAMLPALALYALLPYALFYERMALADPLAAALAALVAWQSIRLTRKPTHRRGALLGLLIGLAVMAKLAAALVAGLPIMAAMLVGGAAPARWNRAAIDSWSRALGKRYGPALNRVYAVYALIWLIFGLLVVISLRSGGSPVILDTNLLGVRDQSTGTLAGKLDAIKTILADLVSLPMTAVLVICTVLVLWKRPAAALYAVGWLAVLWVPSLVMGISAESRYLMIGTPALATLFGGGIAVAGEAMSEVGARLSARRRSDQADRAPERFAHPVGMTTALAVIVLGVWAIAFALPFDLRAANDPARLTLPASDRYVYFAASANGWGIADALAFAERLDGIDGADVPLVAALDTLPSIPAHEYCTMVAFYLPAGRSWNCVTQHEFPDDTLPSDPADWSNLVRALEENAVVYVLSNALSPDTAPADPGQWQILFEQRKPHSLVDVTLWQVSAASP